MKIQIDKTDGKITTLVATYETWLQYDLDELDIDWNKVENIWCKYGTLHIKMEGGKVIKVDTSTESEYGYKWPVQLRLLDDNDNVVWDE